MVSTRLLNKVSPHFEKGVLIVQAGARLESIQKRVANSDYLAITGECPDVGVSGFLLGGGLNLVLSTLFGIASERIR